MITNRANASLTCGRSTCKKERLHKANDDYKKHATADPIKEAYFKHKKCFPIIFNKLILGNIKL